MIETQNSMLAFRTFIGVSFIKERWRKVLFARKGLLVYRFVLCHVFVLRTQLSSHSVSRNVTLNTGAGNCPCQGSNWVGAAWIHLGSVENDNTEKSKAHFSQLIYILYVTCQAFFVFIICFKLVCLLSCLLQECNFFSIWLLRRTSTHFLNNSLNFMFIYLKRRLVYYFFRTHFNGDYSLCRSHFPGAVCFPSLQQRTLLPQKTLAASGLSSHVGINR